MLCCVMQSLPKSHADPSLVKFPEFIYTLLYIKLNWFDKYHIIKRSIRLINVVWGSSWSSATARDFSPSGPEVQIPPINKGFYLSHFCNPLFLAISNVDINHKLELKRLGTNNSFSQAI